MNEKENMERDAVNRALIHNNTQSFIWLDVRNHIAVYNIKKSPQYFLDAMTSAKAGGRAYFINQDDHELGKITYRIMSTEEWGNRGEPDIPPNNPPPEYFNKNYFRHGPKSCFAHEYLWDSPFQDVIRKEADTILKMKPNKLLDAGCAKGFLCRALLEKGVDAYGFDISQWAIDNCEPEVKGRVRQYKIEDGKPWPYPDASFDTVVAISVLEHVEPYEIPFVLKEMSRLSTNWIYVAIPVSLTKDNRPWGDPTHKCFMPFSWWVDEAWKLGLLFNWEYSSYDVGLVDDVVDNAQVFIAFQKEMTL